MRFIEILPRRNRTHQEASRRNSRYRRGIFNRFQSYKLMIAFGKKKPIKKMVRRSQNFNKSLIKLSLTN
jgi:hypothetical protein